MKEKKRKIDAAEGKNLKRDLIRDTNQKLANIQKRAKEEKVANGTVCNETLDAFAVEERNEDRDFPLTPRPSVN